MAGRRGAPPGGVSGTRELSAAGTWATVGASLVRTTGPPRIDAEPSLTLLVRPRAGHALAPGALDGRSSAHGGGVVSSGPQRLVAARARALEGRAAGARRRHRRRPRGGRARPVRRAELQAPGARIGARVWGAVQLADGAQIVIRPIEPEDAGELRRGLRRLSALTAYRRFRAHIITVTPEQPDYLTRIDHVRHEALAALDPQVGSVVGVVRYVSDPRSPRRLSLRMWSPTRGSTGRGQRADRPPRRTGARRRRGALHRDHARRRRPRAAAAHPSGRTDRRTRPDGVIETTARLRPPARQHPSNPDTPHASPAS